MEPAHYVSALEHQCKNHPTFTLLEYHFGTQAHIHDVDVTVRTNQQNKCYRIFFTKHAYLPVNVAINGVLWRGSLAVFRSSANGPGLVNIRAGETALIDRVIAA
jgi:hypothetical protein